MRKKLRKLVEEQLSQKDTFADDEDLEEDSLVKSTVKNLLEGNIDVFNENEDCEVGGFGRKMFPLENSFSSKAYSGRKVSRQSLKFGNCENREALKLGFDKIDKSLPKSKRNERKTSGNISKMSRSVSSESESINDEEILSDDSNRSFDIPINSPVKLEKNIQFGPPLSDEESVSDENASVEPDENNSDNEDSEIEDDLSDEEGAEVHTTFLYSKSFKDESSQIEKGLAIRNQLSLWEVLLESRIMLQKCLVTSNTLPKHDKFSEISSQFSQTVKDSMIECKEKVWDLLEKLILIQDKLRRQNQEFVKNGSDEILVETDKDDEEFNLKVKRRKLSDYPDVLHKQYDDYIHYRDCVIQKWNDRTKIASGKWAKSNFSAFDQPILKQIELIMSDTRRLIQRTYVKRSQYDIIGEESSKNKVITEENVLINFNLESDREIFDDDDFYHKLLRDYIDRKTSDISDPTQLGRKWIQLQSLRNKMKRKIDTRRTKGRKIKFDVHPKLINFMAPVFVDRWEESAINELYSSIFGKNLINY